MQDLHITDQKIIDKYNLDSFEGASRSLTAHIFNHPCESVCDQENKNNIILALQECGVLEKLDFLSKNWSTVEKIMLKGILISLYPGIPWTSHVDTIRKVY